MGIGDLIQKARDVINGMIFSSGLHDPEKLGISENDFRGITELLSHINAIKTARGTSKVYISEAIQNKEAILGRLNNIEQTLIKIYNKISNVPTKELSRKEVSELLAEEGESIDDYYTYLGLLSSLNLVTSIGGRTGGIKIYNQEAEMKPVLAAEEVIAKTTDEVKLEKKKTEKEDVLYPSAKKFISDLGFQGLILGVKRRFPGEWNTPDVIGYKVHPYKWLGGAELEIISIEVKWEISKQAIAETNSHQNLSHRSYLFVHQYFDEVNENFRSDLITKGIGLICRTRDKEGYSVSLPANQNSPKNIDLDNFLNNAMDVEELQTLKLELATHYFNSYYKPLFPK